MNFLERFFSGPEDPDFGGGDTFMIVGLGNPGREYVDNRHNIGFMAIDQLARSLNCSLGRAKYKAIIGDGRLGDHRLILVKPQTYMNRSGDSVGPLADFYKLAADHVLVIYDELDLPFGTIRLRENGSAGGHNGMKSIINHLGQDFPRLRLGIGRPPSKMPAHAFVLQDFKGDDIPIVKEMLDRTVQTVETYVQEGIQLAMSRHNGSVLDE